MLKLEFKPYILEFKFSAQTSRGSMKKRKIWFIRISNDLGESGIGEVAPIDRLSPEDPEEIPGKLEVLSKELMKLEQPKSETEAFELVSRIIPKEFPSIRFGLEVGLLDLINGGRKNIFVKDLNSISIPINGLVWMGKVDFMKKQIKEKLSEGFKCIKLKVGALDFETELEIIRDLRNVSDELIIRLDANGAFQTSKVLEQLKALSKYNIHSIEQPILPMQPEAMELICKKSEIPIALDEELIHVFNLENRLSLLQELKPQFVVLKPSLHGGFNAIREWIDLAEMHGIGWWITSYLESNIGLNAIAQFTGRFTSETFHGLGTGHLYYNNIQSPVIVRKGNLGYADSKVWDDIVFD
ncbi:MAG: o-succinylbenzoate synthase [Bacteroidota bacterium]